MRMPSFGVSGRKPCLPCCRTNARPTVMVTSFDNGNMALSAFVDELEEDRVDLFRKGPSDVVRTALDRHKRAVGDHCREPRCSRLEGKDAILGPMHDKHGDIDFDQIS